MSHIGEVSGEEAREFLASTLAENAATNGHITNGHADGGETEEDEPVTSQTEEYITSQNDEPMSE